MFNYSNQLKVIIFIASLLQPFILQGAQQASSHIEESHIPPLPSRQQEIPIPADGNCFYNSIIVAYLLPVVNDFHTFHSRLSKLIGKNHTSNDVQKTFKQLRFHRLPYQLRQQLFVDLVHDMKNHMKIKAAWGGDEDEMQKIANHLQVIIEEYIPDPENTSNLIDSLCIGPESAISANFPKLCLVHDKPSQYEAVNPLDSRNIQKAQAESIENDRHGQHYRALLPKEIINFLKQDDKLKIGNSRKSVKKSKTILKTLKQEMKNNYINRLSIRVPSKARELRWSPSAYECAILSQNVYSYHLKEGDQVFIELEKPITPLTGWKVYRTLQNKNLGYKTVIYLNSSKKQIVLAYRGTESASLEKMRNNTWGDSTNDWYNNILGLAFNQKTNQIKSTRSMVFELKKAIAEQYNPEKYGITITGHSLGGALAQITRAMAHKYRANPTFGIQQHLQVVTFDSPGVKGPMASILQGEPNPQTTMNSFDIKNYYSAPNLVNTLHTSPGTRYRIVFKQFVTPPSRILSYTLETHNIQCFIDACDPIKGSPKQPYLVRRWPTTSKHLIDKLQKSE